MNPAPAGMPAFGGIGGGIGGGINDGIGGVNPMTGVPNNGNPMHDGIGRISGI